MKVAAWFIIQSKIFKNFTTTPLMNSCDFLYDDESEDKAFLCVINKWECWNQWF